MERNPPLFAELHRRFTISIHTAVPHSYARLPWHRRLQWQRQPRHLPVQPTAQVTAQLLWPTALDGLVDRVVDASLRRVRGRVGVKG
jgi:hypothetical protein